MSPRNECERFRHLNEEAETRELTPEEAEFLTGHRLLCEACAREAQSLAMALNFLRGEVLEHDGGEAFERRVIRRWKIRQPEPDSLRAWSPAAITASVVAMAFLAVLQLLTAEPIRTQPSGDQRAMRDAQTKPLMVFDGVAIPDMTTP